MNKNTRVLSVLTLLLAAAGAHAEWKGKGEAGIVFARGNTETDTINLKLGMSTTDRYLATWQSDYNLSSHTFWLAYSF